MIAAVLQARSSSSRLPGKVLKPLLGKPMLARQIERIKKTPGIDRIILATSTDIADDSIEEIAKGCGVDCFRGSLEDVLDRFYKAAFTASPDHVVRLTGDCPLYDPRVGQAVIEAHLKSGADYTSNTLKPTYPDGLDVEVMKFKALEVTVSEARLPSEREHVTPYIYNHPEKFFLNSHVLSQGKNLSALRWVVDEKRDFEFVEKIYEALHADNPDFGMTEILNLLEAHPDLVKINSGIGRNEGYLKALENDKRREQGKNEH